MAVTGEPNSKCMEIAKDIYKMERITAFVNHELENLHCSGKNVVTT